MKKKILLLSLIILMTMMLVPTIAMALSETVVVDGTSGEVTYTLDPVNNNLDTITVKGTVKLEGNAAVSVECEEGATLKLNASIDMSAQDNKCAITFTGLGNKLSIDGDATIKSGNGQPGIKVEQGSELEITATTGDLDVLGGAGGAGIGAAQNNTSGNITFKNTNGHHIVATGGLDACGIGGGKDGASGSANFENAIVFAQGSGAADDIGASGSEKVYISDQSAVFLKSNNIGTTQTQFPLRVDEIITEGKAYGIAMPNGTWANGDIANAYVETSIIIDSDFITNNGAEIDLNSYKLDTYININTTTPITLKYTGIDPLTYTRIKGVIAGVNITIENLNIDVSDKIDAAPISFTGENNNLTLKGENTLKAGANKAAIQVDALMDGQTNLTINGDGSVTVIGGDKGAGIGTGASGLGDIAINGGAIYAKGGNNAAGVGYGESGGCNITINGGLVFAEKGTDGHDVGSKNNGEGNITLFGEALVFLKNNLISGNLSAGGHTFLDSGVITDGKAYDVTVPVSWSNSSAAYAYINKKQVVLSVQGGGQVAPSGTQTVDHGGDLTINVTPDEGYQVKSVTSTESHVIEDKGNNEYLIKDITKNDTINIVLEKKSYTVTVNVAGNGTISPTGNGTVEHGSDYVITLTPDVNYAIKNVTSSDYTIENTVGNIYTIKNVTADGSVDVAFEGAEQTITINAGDHGVVTPSGAQTALYGEDLVIQVTPNEGYHVKLISATSHSIMVNTDGKYTIKNINCDDTINVIYEINEYSVGIEKTGNGAVAPNTTQTIIHNGSLVITPTADAGSHVASVTSQKGHKVTKQDNGSYIVEQIKENDTINVNFAHNAHTISATTSSYGKVEFTGTHEANHGSDFTFKVVPNSGYYTSKVTATKHTVVDNNDGTYTLKNVTAADTITATFSNSKYKVRIKRLDSHGTSSPSSSRYIGYGGDLDIKVTPDEGYHVLDISSRAGHYINNNGGGNYTVKDIKKSDTIEIEFAENHYTLNVRCNTNGTVDPIGYKSATHGENVTIKAKPNQGYHIKSVVAGKHTVKDNSNGEYIVEKVMDNDTVDVTFEVDSHAVTFTNDDSKGLMEGSNTLSIAHNNGIAQGPTIKEKSGYSFVGWSEDNGATIVKDLAEYQVVTDVTFIAQYKQIETANMEEDPDAKKGTLQGVLKDENGKPLAGYHIWLYSSPREVVTDNNGVYTFTDVPFTKHTLIVKSPKGIELNRIAIDFEKKGKAKSEFNEADGKLQVDYTSNVEDIKLDLKVNKTTNKVIADKVNVEEQKSNNFLLILVIVIVGLLIVGIVGSAIYKKYYTGYRH